jgi:hypothetical protein
MKRLWIIASMFVLMIVLIGDMALANTGMHFMRIGRLWVIAEYDGAEGWDGQYVWPGGYLRYPEKDISQMWGANVRKTGTITGCTNWTGPNGTIYPFWTSGMYRIYDYDYLPYWKDQTHQTALYPVTQILYQRWAQPKITVNGEDISPPTGRDPGVPYLPVETQIDPDLITEMAIKSVWRYSMGVEYERWLYAYSNPNHQDYALYDIKLTNNGKIYGLDKDPPDEWPYVPPEYDPAWPQILENQRIEGFWWTQTENPWNSRSGRDYSFGADDAVGEFIAPFSGEGNDRRFYLFYDGDHEGDGVKDWCDPSIDERWVELLSPAWIIMGALYADVSPDNKINDNSQPKSTTIAHERNYELGKTVKTMQEQYNTLFAASSHWPLDTPHRDIDPAITRPSGYTAFGPYDMDFGESVDIIYVVAAGGINHNLCVEYGKKAWNAGYTGPIMDEIENLHKTGRDSVIKTLKMAEWNVNGNKGGRTKFDVPDAPRPPAEFHVQAESSKIVLEWSDEAENEPDFDSGVNDFVGYRLYRAAGRSDSSYNLIWEGTARKYEDTDVSAMEQYFYYLTVYDDGTQNWEDPGVSLESGRFWCWTGWIQEGITISTSSVNSGANLEIPKVYTLYQNYPNPFNPTTSIDFSLPKSEFVTLKIYNILGEEIATILNNKLQAGNHTYQFDGSHLASGVYLCRIEAGEYKHVKKMILLR